MQCGCSPKGNCSQGNKPQSSPNSTIALVSDPRPRLFAVVCGINAYESKDFSRLRGAVKDAEAVVDLLVTNYHVPRAQIILLTDKAASRSSIISTLDGLSTDPRIQPGDPILFYFAGHGSEIDPPKGWECGGPNGKIQVLVPQDYCSEADRKIPGIPDRTIGFLLDKIAHTKGDNITVIFDCCHAASGTRGDLVRSVEVDSSIHTSILDIHIWGEHTARRGLASHVLLAACRPSELAREKDERGAFTTTLLKLLREVPPHELRYCDILHKIGPLSSQNPQCEGLHQGRYLFNAKVVSPAPVTYVPRYDPAFNAIVVNAGIAHGVTDGAEFAFYVAQDPHPGGKPLGIYVVDKATPFYSIMKPIGGSSMSALPSGLAAFQTQAGQGNALRVYISEAADRPTSSPRRVDKISRACGRDLRNVQFVDSRDKAHLELAIKENQVVITVRDPKTTQQGRYQLPPRTITWDELGPFLSKAKLFYSELDRSSIDTDVVKDIGIEFHRLQEMPSSFHNVSEPDLRPFGSNRLLPDGMIHLAVEDRYSYGVKLTNRGPYDLYPSLFYFDGSDPTRIRTYYEPSSSGPYLLEPPLKRNGGTLTIGYGSAGIPPFSYPVSGKVNVGFLKLLVSTRPLNSSSGTGPCLCSSGAQYAGRALKETWGTATIPIIHEKPNLRLVRRTMTT
ncbi:hypothetical protein M413DRAFT_445103 [Hebeloma cylindrosporum]|uniref:Peptidase C14 caspase domain-containing protein n=1 Tax=Hebeloma cylindrosporum TaxID=76867 RepID=A0A0C2XW47_HEBCY|nr:hypothetical protein M413DRAFT_445103 [Hebeloma cylindrosporum h7]